MVPALFEEFKTDILKLVIIKVEILKALINFFYINSIQLNCSVLCEVFLIVLMLTFSLTELCSLFWLILLILNVWWGEGNRFLDASRSWKIMSPLQKSQCSNLQSNLLPTWPLLSSHHTLWAIRYGVYTVDRRVYQIKTMSNIIQLQNRYFC